MNISGNKNNIAIVVVGYNRKKSIKRLLNSLLNSHYLNDNVPLVICLDNCGNNDVYDFANQFNWRFGEKFIIHQTERQGLKNHILKCGNLTKFFKAIIMLEDDLYVSPFFYNYVKNSLNQYLKDDNVAGISLYRNEINGYVGLPFTPLNNGFDVFAIQSVSSWGQCWTSKMWDGFILWLENNDPIDFDSIDMIDNIKSWDKAWSKYFYAYIITTNKFYIFPYVSLSTNFGDSGENNENAINNTDYQTNLSFGKSDYNIPSFDKLVKYDVYFNFIGFGEFCKINDNELCVDFWGTNNNKTNKKYILSPFKLPFKIIKSYAMKLRPIELNVIFNIGGDSLFLYDTKMNFNQNIIKEFSYSQLKYFSKGFNIMLMFQLVSRNLVQIFKTKLKKLFIHGRSN